MSNMYGMAYSDILHVILGIRMISAIGAECLFPEYIQSPLDEFGEPMPWHTKMRWLSLRNEPKLREMQEVYVLRSNIWSQRQNNRGPCDRKSRRVRNRATPGMFGSCSEKDFVYNRTCLTEERFNHFKVIQYGPGRDPTFLCMKFIKRSDNIVQIMEGPAKKLNDNDLCDERKLHLHEWPWIARWRRKVVTCPISGGFSFRTINKLTNEDFCVEEWRKSRLEIDCAKGDGLNFIAPKGSKCNPFSSKSEVTKFYCWAGWQEKLFTFLVVGDEKGEPQFCLRFPRDLSQQFSVMVYFSVLCPMQEDGMPPTGIEYHELQMNTLAPDQCVDDDAERCHIIEKRGQCKKEEKYGIHCQRTCKKCVEATDMLKMMCPFSSSIQGSWLFIDVFHKEAVQINSTNLHFSDFGNFICKERSVFSEKLYKTVTVLDNGCAMRYTCFELQRRNNNVLQFRVGKSYRTDIGFDTLCQFEDSSSPVVDPYRSSTMKNLILDGRHRDEYCGFSHTIPFNGTVYGETCAGTITDWDSDGCVTRGVIYISSDTCSNLATPIELQCLAFLDDHPLEQFLITKSMLSGNYNCWVLTSFLCSHWDWKYRALVKLDSPQCITLADSTCALDRTPEALLYLHDEDKSRFCKGVIGNKIVTTTSHSSATQFIDNENIDRPYNIPNKDDSSATVYQSPYYVDSDTPRDRMNSRYSISIASSILCSNSSLVLFYLVTLMCSICVFPT